MEPIIKIEGLSKLYSGVAALEPLKLEVHKGEVLGYLGPNGAGKTTTIRLLLGLIAPTAGSASIFGLDSQKKKIEIHKKLAYIPGETMLWPSLTGAETLHLLGKLQVRPALFPVAMGIAHGYPKAFSASWRTRKAQAQCSKVSGESDSLSTKG